MGKCPPNYKICGNSLSSPSEISCVLWNSNNITITSDDSVKRATKNDEEGVLLCPLTEIKIGKGAGPQGAKEH